MAEITYLTWTADGLLRHTVYVGLREDKPANQVRREVSRETLSLVLAAAIFQVSELGADVRATNSRIDQTYSTLLQQESDIGSILTDHERLALLAALRALEGD